MSLPPKATARPDVRHIPAFWRSVDAVLKANPETNPGA